MGCNESKQAVATSDTIKTRSLLRKKSSAKSKVLNPLNENNVNIVTTSPSVPEPESNQTNNEDVKEISESTDSKDGQNVGQAKAEEVVVAKEHEAAGESILLPDDFHSSRKDEDVADSVSTEDGYFSPNHDSVKDGDLKDDVELNDDVELKEEEKKVDEVQKKSLVNEQEKIKEDEKGKHEDLKEPALTKEDQVKTIKAPEVPVVTTADQVVSEEPSSDSLLKDGKVN
ncbi:hypothetical protein IFM89_007046 [Coptis chinensis]|uniref:Uncharacterized protein n=1 Tax=Coptis chinensis TaxID=261450 RepID=A0A835IK91_9MAGN|nr:hypothetical protein IFM89_007046 [Coptis chinensis]